MEDFLNEIKNNILDTIIEYDNKNIKDFSEIDVGIIDEKLLASKIFCLPNDYAMILTLYFYFELDTKTISNILDQDYIIGHIYYIFEILCVSMKLPINSYFPHHLMKSACSIYINECADIQQYKDLELIPQYSENFKQNIKKIISREKEQKSPQIIAIFTRRIAVCLLVLIITFTVTLTVNAELRERFFNWIHNTFPAFSEFGTDQQDIVNNDYIIEKLHNIKIGYIPEDFILSDEIFLTDTVIDISYTNKNNNVDTIYIMATSNAESLTAYDTEGVVVREIEYKGNPAFIWQNKGTTFLVWQQDGFMCDIVADLTEDDIFLIADSITF